MSSAQETPDRASNSSETGAADTPVLEWTVHPVRRRPWVSVAVSFFVVAVVVLVRVTTESQAFAVLAMVIMAASLAKFYFPTRYKLDAKGVTIKTTTQTLVKEWKLYRSCYPDKNGILLSPFAEPSRLENFRGVYLMFHENAKEVTACCRDRLAAVAAEGKP